VQCRYKKAVKYNAGVKKAVQYNAGIKKIMLSTAMHGLKKAVQ